METVCSFPECGKKRDSKEGLCTGHKKQLREGRPLKAFKVPIKICTFEGCGRRHYRKGLCAPHDSQREKGLPLTTVKSHGKRGDGCIATNGYKKYTTGTGKDRVEKYEHRLVMERHISRELLPEENVHHINGNRLDNRIENLELWVTRQPTGQRVENLVQWAKEILARYGSLVTEPSADAS